MLLRKAGPPVARLAMHYAKYRALKDSAFEKRSLPDIYAVDLSCKNLNRHCRLRAMSKRARQAKAITIAFILSFSYHIMSRYIISPYHLSCSSLSSAAIPRPL